MDVIMNDRVGNLSSLPVKLGLIKQPSVALIFEI